MSVSPSSTIPAVASRSSRRRTTFLLLLLPLVALGPIALIVAKIWAKPPPVLSTLSPFELTNQEGRAFGSHQLQGKVWIANFIFTRCPTVCPKFTGTMGELQNRTRLLGDKLQLVSFSVDPEHDQPPVLHAYAEKYHADSRRWSFLTGDAAKVRGAVMEGLKVSFGRKNEDPTDLEAIFHGTHFVLIDADLRIRGYYRSDEADAVNSLVKDAEHLVRRGG
jgi:protein SCO1